MPKPPDTAIPASPSKTRGQTIAVALKGCLDGNRLETTADAITDSQLELLNASEFVLQGPRELLRQLTHDHRGHEELITGVAIIPPQPADVTVDAKTETRGKTRVTAGVRESGLNSAGVFAPDLKLPVRIRVESATHLADRCVPQR